MKTSINFIKSNLTILLLSTLAILLTSCSSNELTVHYPVPVNELQAGDKLTVSIKSANAIYIDFDIHECNRKDCDYKGLPKQVKEFDNFWKNYDTNGMNKSILYRVELTHFLTE